MLFTLVMWWSMLYVAVDWSASLTMHSDLLYNGHLSHLYSTSHIYPPQHSSLSSGSLSNRCVYLQFLLPGLLAHGVALEFKRIFLMLCMCMFIIPTVSSCFAVTSWLSRCVNITVVYFKDWFAFNF